MHESVGLKDHFKIFFPDNIQKNFTDKIIAITFGSSDNLCSDFFLFLCLCCHTSFSFDIHLEKKWRSAKPHSSKTCIIESFLLVVSRDTQLRCLSGVGIIKSPTWTTAITSCCRTRHPVKMSIAMGVYPVPYPAQLFTVLSHRGYYYPILQTHCST